MGLGAVFRPWADAARHPGVSGGEYPAVRGRAAAGRGRLAGERLFRPWPRRAARFTAENWAKTAPDYTDSPELLAYIIDMPFDESTLDIYLQNGRVTGTDRTLEH